MDVIIEMVFIATGALIAYLFYLREKIVVKMQDLKGDRTYPGIIFLPVKFNLHDEYPDKDILRLSRLYDKWLGVLYFVVAIGCLFAILYVIFKD